MKNWKIPLFQIYWDEEDVKLTSEAIKKGMDWAIGSNVEIFEENVSKYVGTKYSLTFNSGTSALHAALLAHGIEKGCEVIVPSFTFIATANAPLFVGAKPIFADIEAETYGLDPEDVKEKISKKTRAIIPIHYAGCPCLIRELREIAEDHNLILLEDASESLGAGIDGRKVGTFGDSAIFSFCSNKIISTGEGGAIVTNSRDIYERLKLIRSHGRLETSNYFSSSGYMDYVTLGYNFRMSNIVAALGISQLNKVDKIIEMRRKNAEYLITGLNKDVNGIITPKSPMDYYHVYQMFTVRVDNRDNLMDFLSSKGVMTKVYFSPVHLTGLYKKKHEYLVDLPVTEDISSQVLTLPIYPTLSKEDMDYMVGEIKNFYNGAD